MPQPFPRATHAEDQPLAPLILTTHVLHRGFQTGALLALPVGLASHAYLRRLRPERRVPLWPALVRTTGVCSVAGVGLMGLALAGRMWGREEIEWKDRAWRLLENKGQVEVDGWSLGGMVAGLVGLGVLRGSWKGGGWKLGVGSAGVGSGLGVVGYVIWRHGVKEGKWED